MPLVFVHGVNNRVRPGFQAGIAARDALFRRFTLAALSSDAAGATVLNPFWGGHGAQFRWGLACLPEEDGDTEQLGTEGEDIAPLAAAAIAQAGPDAAPDAVLLAAARRDFPATVDLVLAAGSLDAEDRAPAFAEAAARAAVYAEAHPEPPAWVDEVGSDEEFLDRLQLEIDAESADVPAPDGATGGAGGEFEQLGLGDLWDAVRGGADRLRVAASDAVGTKVYAAVRRFVAPTVATFLGDVFEYLSHRGTPQDPGPIVTVVGDAIREAASRATATDGRVVVVGHSLGGVIAYDLLTSYVTDVEVDALVTVGSQVGLFEELKLFLGSDPRVPASGEARISKPATVTHWVNVFDNSDLLSYRVSPLVRGVEEFRYPTGELVTAHGAYFGQPRFHQRLADRLGSLIST